MSSNLRLAGRGRPGEDESGSKAGSSEGRRGAELLASRVGSALLPGRCESAMSAASSRDAVGCFHAQARDAVCCRSCFSPPAAGWVDMYSDMSVY
jgi:hypothetical protein